MNSIYKKIFIFLVISIIHNLVLTICIFQINTEYKPHMLIIIIKLFMPSITILLLCMTKKNKSTAYYMHYICGGYCVSKLLTLFGISEIVDLIFNFLNEKLIIQIILLWLFWDCLIFLGYYLFLLYPQRETNGINNDLILITDDEIIDLGISETNKETEMLKYVLKILTNKYFVSGTILLSVLIIISFIISTITNDYVLLIKGNIFILLILIIVPFTSLYVRTNNVVKRYNVYKLYTMILLVFVGFGISVAISLVNIGEYDFNNFNILIVPNLVIGGIIGIFIFWCLSDVFIFICFKSKTSACLDRNEMSVNINLVEMEMASYTR